MIEFVLIPIAIVLLVLIQGFFSGAEIAVVHSDRTRLKHRAKEGQSGSALALRLLERPEYILTTTLVGTNIALVLSTVLGTALLIGLLGDIGGLVAVIVLTPVTLLFGEIVPKSICQQESDRLTPKIIYPLYALLILLFPIIFLFSRVARLVARIVGRGKPGAEMFAVREQLRSVLEAAEGHSPEHLVDRIRIRNVVRFGELVAGDLMTPAGEMTAIDSGADIADAIKLVRSTGYDHIPIFEGQRSNVTGMLSLTLWDLIEPGLANVSINDFVRPAHFVPVQQPVAELLPILRGRDDLSAFVVDEFGSVVGLINLDMILSSIVGAVDVGTSYEARQSSAAPSYEQLVDDEYLMDARLPIADVNDLLATKISTAAAHTIGGLVVARLRHVPQAGESIIESGFRIVVEEATERAIKRVRVSREP